MARTPRSPRPVRARFTHSLGAAATPEGGPANPETAAAAAAPAAPQDPGFITVRVGRLPGRIETIALNGGRKVMDALQGAGLDGHGHEIKVNAAPANTDTELKQDDTVLLVRKIRGNA